MAWRLTRFLIEGMLDNTVLGKVTGWITFAGLKDKVTFELKGDFHRDIRGTKIYFKGDAEEQKQSTAYMEGFASHQKGNVGDITAGLEPRDYVGYPYIEWYGDANGRVVIELEHSQIKVIGKPIPADKCEPISHEEQAKNMADFMTGLADENFGSKK